ncbi:MAG: FIST C-terminal domain-containing protein [Treponema sp.]|jgi:hypothetical protein|nr:FIST C-terminal domain-containing protein [Treponema sp.]
MIRLLTAFTFEIDDPKLASDEIQKQLEAEDSLFANSVGFLFCSLDFINSGAAAAVAKALPFETIGCTTHGIAVPGAMSEVMLTVAVLTSDDVVFKIGVSDPLEDDGEERLREMYERLFGFPEPPPSLLLMCHSNPAYLSGDRVLRIFDSLSGGTPVFGTYALDETFERRMPMILHNGTAYSNRLALVAICGGVPERRFVVKTLPAINIYSQSALVTEAQDNRLISINNMPAAEFMEKLGVISENNTNAVYGFPLLVNNNDGTGLKSCAIHSIEDGGVLRCGSGIVNGATLKIVNQMQAEVLHNSEELIALLKNEGNKKAHVIFSCFGRSAPLLDLKDEMSLFQDGLPGISYVFIYSSGEFCPMYDELGGTHNRFHQYSIVSLSF